MNCRQLFYILTFFAWACPFVWAAQTLPNGLVLNYTFEEQRGGLVLDKSPFGLHAQRGALEILPAPDSNKNGLYIQSGQFLAIPASSLLNPKNCCWIITINFYAHGDGLLFSQGTADHHIALYLKDGKPHARIKQGRFVHVLHEKEGSYKTDTFSHTLVAQNCLEKWSTLTLEIRPSKTSFYINRNLIGVRHILDPIPSDIYTAQIGANSELEPAGFDGVIGALKFLRQPL